MLNSKIAKINNMKYINISAFLIVIFSIVSCSNLLEENPTTFFDEETIYSTEEGVESAINGLYYIQGSFNYYGSAYQSLVMPVSGIFYSSQLANRDATSLNTTTINTNLEKLWASQYQLINAANVAIANLTDSELENRDSALGHAYFLRGNSYSELYRFFGAVPLRTEPTEIDDIHKSRSTREATVQQIIDDLTQAKSLMASAQSTLYGRPGNLAANVVLAKLYTYEAGREGGDASNWQKAYDELLPVIQSEEYELTPTYAELFQEGNDNSVESIFEIQYGNTGGGRTSDIVRLYTPSNSVFAPTTTTTFGRIRPNKEFFDMHRALYPDDPRIDATYLYDSYPKNDGGTQKIYPDKQTGNQGFPVIAKWFDSNYNGTTTDRNYILIRYADVLMMMAEIENELNGPGAAYDYINQVLARARDIDGDGVSDSVEPADWSGMDQDEFRSRIMRERLYELLSEGQEWFDTRRRGYDWLRETVIIPHNTNPTFDSDKDFMYPDDAKNLLLPIPISELSGNQMLSAEDQNPGY